MAENSKIEWTDHTFNGWIGCTKVSPACDHCYAEVSTPARVSRSQGNETWGPHAPRKRTSAANWKKPLKWNEEAKAEGVRKRVFCLSLGDVFDNHKSILQEWRDDLWALIRATPHLDWQLLTKRPQNIKKYLPDDWGDGYPNVWLGTTVENQQEAERRIPTLLRVPAKMRFLSCEPLLGPLQLWGITESDEPPLTKEQIEAGETISGWNIDCLRGSAWDDMNGTLSGEYKDDFGDAKINWVIVGGESGPSARSCERSWMDGIVEDCNAAGVPVFVKQLGANYADPKNGICGKFTEWPFDEIPDGPSHRLKHAKGGDTSEWPFSLHIQEFPSGHSNG